MQGGECLYHMPTTTIFGYCVFDQVIDLADEAATMAIEAEMENYLNGTGANFTVVSADVAEASLFEGALFFVDIVISYVDNIFPATEGVVPRHIRYC